MYRLRDKSDREIISETPGTLGGHRKHRIYGRLDCPSAKRWIEKGFYVAHRVFFADEKTAKSAGYRPCARCMPEAHKDWKSSRLKGP
jgi:methylphosphotriester-DNA--protein-cysteine methyltransferase